MRILGIDPGYAICGYGVIEKDGQRLKCLDYGTFSTPAKTPFEQRLLSIYAGTRKLILSYKPDAFAIEELFFAQNTTTAFGTAQARGILLLAAAQMNVPIFEYKPSQIKMAVTGYGKAEKHQIQDMVRRLLKLQENPQPDDAADALAVAICQAHTGFIDEFRLRGTYQ